MSNQPTIDIERCKEVTFKTASKHGFDWQEWAKVHTEEYGWTLKTPKANDKGIQQWFDFVQENDGWEYTHVFVTWTCPECENKTADVRMGENEDCELTCAYCGQTVKLV